MPAKSQAQLRLMQAVAHNPKFAKEVGIPQSVGKEFAMGAVKALRSHKVQPVGNLPAMEVKE